MKKIRLTAAILALTLALSFPALAWETKPQDLTKVDVTFDESVDPANRPSEWAKTELQAAAEAGLIPESMSGDPKLQHTITREQFAELAVNMTSVIFGEGLDISQTKAFTDCDNPAVLAAAAVGIVDGVGNSKFDPKATTTREQIATMLFRAITYLETEMEDAFLLISPDISAFSDKASVSPWAAEGVGALAANNIMKGTSATTLSPQSPCSIEQSVLLVYRIYAMLTSGE